MSVGSVSVEGADGTECADRSVLMSVCSGCGGCVCFVAVFGTK